jgi:hypothetical protein
MDKTLAIAICIFVVILAFIYTDKTNNTNDPTNPTTSNNNNKRKGFGPITPIITPPLLNLSIYEDGNCTTEITNIDWGVMHPNETKSKTIYIKNTGNADAVNLTLRASEWVFKDANGTLLNSDYQQYFNLTWNIEGATIPQGAVITATITLSVSILIEKVSEFAFNIHIDYHD